MLRQVVLFFAVVALVRGKEKATPIHRPCEHHESKLPLDAFIVGCRQPPCLLPQLKDFIILIKFRHPNTIYSMTTLATIYSDTNSVGIPYSLGENAQTCAFLTNTHCATLPGEIVRYNLRMYVDQTLPVGLESDIEFRIVDDRNTPVMCLRVPIRIVEHDYVTRAALMMTFLG